MKIKQKYFIKDQTCSLRNYIDRRNRSQLPKHIHNRQTRLATMSPKFCPILSTQECMWEDPLPALKIQHTRLVPIFNPLENFNIPHFGSVFRRANFLLAKSFPLGMWFSMQQFHSSNNSSFLFVYSRGSRLQSTSTQMHIYVVYSSSYVKSIPHIHRLMRPNSTKSKVPE